MSLELTYLFSFSSSFLCLSGSSISLILSFFSRRFLSLSSCAFWALNAWIDFQNRSDTWNRQGYKAAKNEKKIVLNIGCFSRILDMRSERFLSNFLRIGIAAQCSPWTCSCRLWPWPPCWAWTSWPCPWSRRPTSWGASSTPSPHHLSCLSCRHSSWTWRSKPSWGLATLREPKFRK